MTLPNILTLVRMALIPVFLVAAAMGTPTGDIAALVIFIVASVTDWLDGYIARAKNQVTNFGKFVDPLADKLLVMSAMLVFVERGVMPTWAFVIILARELMITSLRTLAAADGVIIAASIWGKAKTVVQMVSIIFLLSGIEIPAGNFMSAQDMVIYFMVIITAVSGIDYLVKGFSVIKDGISGKGGSK